MTQVTGLTNGRGGLKQGSLVLRFPFFTTVSTRLSFRELQLRKEAVVLGKAGAWGSSPPEYSLLGSEEAKEFCFLCPRVRARLPGSPRGGGETAKEGLCGSLRRAQPSRRGLPSESWP